MSIERLLRVARNITARQKARKQEVADATRLAKQRSALRRLPLSEAIPGLRATGLAEGQATEMLLSGASDTVM